MSEETPEETFTEQYEFKVIGAIQENGGLPHVYAPQASLYVKAIDMRIPVALLEFDGYSAVRGGDTITARLVRSRENEPTAERATPLGMVVKALEIRIHGEGILDSRIERSTDYGAFVKKEV